MSGTRTAPGGAAGTAAPGPARASAPPPGVLPGYEFIPSPYHWSRSGSAVTAVIYHYTAGPRLEGTVRWFQQNPNSVSAHFVVGKDGRTVQMVGLDRSAAHAGKGWLPGLASGNVNRVSIGIEIVNWGQLVPKGGGFVTHNGQRYTGTPVRAPDQQGTMRWWDPYTDAQYDALARLTKALLGRLPTIRWLTGHEDVALPRGRKSDPGGAFDWRRLRSALGGTFTGHVGPLPAPDATGPAPGVTTPTASAPPAGTAGALLTPALQKAIEANRRYRSSLGWLQHVDRIARLVGFTDMTPDEGAFAEGVAGWQAANGLASDGIVGPDTWRALSRALGLAASPSAPAAAPAAGTPRVDPAVLARIDAYATLIDSAAREQGIAPGLIRGLIAAESAGDPRAGAGGTGYKGLMQAGTDDAQLDPATSIRTGAKKLKDFTASLNRTLAPYGKSLRDLPRDDADMMLVLGYNAGPGTIRKALKYAADAGDPARWFDAEHYRRALLFTGAYSFAGARRRCAPGATDADLASARRTRLRFCYGAKGCQVKSWNQDPPPWRDAAPALPALVRCAIEFKHEHSPGYWQRVLAYRRHYERR